jgi:Na+/H+ antiporter NhaC
VSTGLGLGTEIGLVAMSACLAGAECGDHCSPISDTTIMSSAGAGCNHLEHVSTQLPYAITVAAVSFVSYLMTGALSLLLPDGFPLAAVALPLAILLMLGTVLVIRAIVKKKEKTLA